MKITKQKKCKYCGQVKSLRNIPMIGLVYAHKAHQGMRCRLLRHRRGFLRKEIEEWLIKKNILRKEN